MITAFSSCLLALTIVSARAIGGVACASTPAKTADAALLLFATLPVVILYAVLQRWLMRGLTEGAVKL